MYERGETDKPYATGVIVAFDETPEDDDFIVGKVLNPGTKLYNPVIGGNLRFGDYISLYIEEIEGKVIQPTKEVLDLYQQFNNLHSSASYAVSSYLWGPYKVEKGNFGRAEKIDGTDIIFDLENKTLKNGDPVNSLDTAYQWLLENEHAYIFGATIKQHQPGDINKSIPSGNFVCYAVPCEYYSDGYYENFENRRRYAEKEARRLGTTVGGPTAEEILQKLNIENPENKEFGESLTEDTVKQGNKWVNKGKEGTHGKFATKKEADAQRKAMFVNKGYTTESLEEDEEETYPSKWEDFDTIEISNYAEDPVCMAVILSSSKYPYPDGKLVVTVNLGDMIGNDVIMPAYCAFIDINNCSYVCEESIEDYLVKIGLAEPYTRWGEVVTGGTGFVSYPLYQFNKDKLREMGAKGMKEYETLWRKSFLKIQDKLFKN